MCFPGPYMRLFGPSASLQGSRTGICFDLFFTLPTITEEETGLEAL